MHLHDVVIHVRHGLRNVQRLNFPYDLPNPVHIEHPRWTLADALMICAMGIIFACLLTSWFLVRLGYVN